MKYKIILLLLTLCFAVIADTPKAPWLLFSHSLDFTKAEGEINAKISEGYLPTGLFVKEGQAFIILYIYNEKRNFDKWLLQQFKDPLKFESEFSEIIKNGWVPVAGSKDKSGINILFLNLDLTIEDWRVLNGKPESAAMKKDLEKMTNEGFICYDFSISPENTYLYIFLKTPESKTKKNQILTIPSDSDLISTELNKVYKQGWLPWGVAFYDNKWSFLLFQ